MPWLNVNYYYLTASVGHLARKASLAQLTGVFCSGFLAVITVLAGLVNIWKHDWRRIHMKTHLGLLADFSCGCHTEGLASL